MMRRYENADEFMSINGQVFNDIQAASQGLSSPTKLGATGMPLQEAERLAYVFLDLVNKCTDLMFGLSASAANAKSQYKKSEAIGFREADGRVKDKEFAAVSSDEYMRWQRNHNDLDDVYNYLKLKREDFEKAHFYYKHLMGGK